MTNLTELYFRPKAWEGEGAIYKMLGVLVFKKIATKVFPKSHAKTARPNNYYLWQKTVAGLRAYEKRTRYSETIHLVGIIVPIIGLIIGNQELPVQLILWFLSGLNIYPILLQRYNRIRLYRVLKIDTTANKWL